jgi:hypothetical protein
MHARRHLLAWVRPWTAHGVAVRHTLGMHARIVWIARGHHLAGSSARSAALQAVAMRAREGAIETGRNDRSGGQERPASPLERYGGDAYYCAQCMRTLAVVIASRIVGAVMSRMAATTSRVLQMPNYESRSGTGEMPQRVRVESPRRDGARSDGIARR